MLLNNFFFIDDYTQLENSIEATIHVDAQHPILKGHFPEQAVVPGVCMIEMIKEVIHHVTGMKLVLTQSAVIKFLIPFTPPEPTRAVFNIRYHSQDRRQWMIDADLKADAVLFFKFKGEYAITE